MTKRKHCYVDFGLEPYQPQFEKAVGGFAVGGDNDECYFYTQDREYFEWINTGANAAIFFQNTVAAPFGWTIPVDATNGDGVEITKGIVAAGVAGSTSFTIGTDDAFFVRACFNIPVVADQDVVCVGFRRLAAYADITTPASLNAYTDAAWLGIYDNAGAFGSNTELNNGGLVTTAATHIAHVATEYCDLTVKVSDAGVVTYAIGTGATVAAAKAASAVDTALAGIGFTFDSTDIVVPSIAIVSTGAGAASSVTLCEFECGYQNP